MITGALVWMVNDQDTEEAFPARSTTSSFTECFPSASGAAGVWMILFGESCDWGVTSAPSIYILDSDGQDAQVSRGPGMAQSDRLALETAPAFPVLPPSMAVAQE